MKFDKWYALGLVCINCWWLVLYDIGLPYTKLITSSV